MTTIAFKDGLLVADTAVTDNGKYLGQVCKIHKIQNFMLAGAGSLLTLNKFMEWFRMGADVTKPFDITKENGFDVICIDLNTKEIWEYNSDILATKIDQKYYALGTGTDFALGAMHAGATAKEAVEIACKIDIYSRKPLTCKLLW